MVPGEAEGERGSHTEGEKGKTLNNHASKSFLYNFFSLLLCFGENGGRHVAELKPCFQ